MKKSDASWQGHLAILTANVLWGLNAPIGKEALHVLSATAVSAYRLIGGCAAFWLLSLFLPRERVTGRDKVLFVFAALFGFTFNQGLFIYGLSLTTPVDAAIIASSLPIVTMVLAALFLREPVTWKKSAGIALGISGALMLIFGSLGGPGSGGSLTGNLMCFLAQVSFGIYLTLFKGLISRYSPVTVSKWLFLFGAILFLPLSANEVAAVPYAALPAALWARVSYIIFGATFLAYLCVPVGQQRLRPTVVSMYNYTQPVVATIVSVALGLSRFGWKSAVAVGLIFTGVWFVTQSKSRAQMEQERSSRASR